MRRFIIICLAIMAICSCHKVEINALKEQVNILQNELNNLQSQINDNELSLVELKARKDSVHKCLDEIKITKELKEKVADSLYKELYPSSTGRTYASGNTSRGVNQEIVNNPRFKIKNAIVY